MLCVLCSNLFLLCLPLSADDLVSLFSEDFLSFSPVRAGILLGSGFSDVSELALTGLKDQLYSITSQCCVQCHLFSNLELVIVGISVLWKLANATDQGCFFLESWF